MSGDKVALWVGIVVGVHVAAWAARLIFKRMSRWRGSKWGMNPGSLSCPACAAPAPNVRRAKSWRQFWWGGWTCAACGCEADKWGVRVDKE